MNKLIALAIAGALLGGAIPAMAKDKMMSNKEMMKMMDGNRDGMISKDEYMKFHEQMFDSMKMNSQGMVEMKDMQMMPKGGMMKSGMKGDSMMNDGSMKAGTKGDSMSGGQSK